MNATILVSLIAYDGCKSCSSLSEGTLNLDPAAYEYVSYRHKVPLAAR